MTLLSKTYWGGMPFDFREPPERARVEPVKLRTEDLREVRGLSWAPSEGTPKVGVLLMHPRVDFTRHYSIPRLVQAGYSVLALNSRNPNDDTDTVHEELVLDVAAGVAHLRQALGVSKVVLLGNSGGGALMALFQAQAALAPEARIARTPAGAPTMLPRARLTPADGLILVAAHRGEGHVLERIIDPSVVDERDPTRTDVSLDMYDARNGFLPPPEPCTYDRSFVLRYREAQRARVRRIDERAFGFIERIRQARRAERSEGYADLSFAERQAVERAKHTRHVMIVYRTMANLDYVDPSLDPSPRDYGSLLSDRPDLMNLSLPGLARTLTPRAWLSTWSANHSNADLTRTLPSIAVPVLALHAERDKEIFPASDLGPISAALAGEDRTVGTIEGAGHYFEPPFGHEGAGREGAAPSVSCLMDVVVPWIRQRYG